MLKVKGRSFATQALADRYLAGYGSYPRWPQTMQYTSACPNGVRMDAVKGSPEACGYYDAEREEEERWDD